MDPKVLKANYIIFVKILHIKNLRKLILTRCFKKQNKNERLSLFR